MENSKCSKYSPGQQVSTLWFTVVVPLFNKERHVVRAVSSVLNQSHEQFELIIVNDGSTDGSLKALDMFKSELRLMIVSQTNQGVSAARNTGIKAARHPYIAFLDADDEWKPNFLSSIAELIKKFPNAGAFCTAYEFREGDKAPYPSFHYSEFKANWTGCIDNYFRHALKHPIVTASSVVVPKMILETLGGFYDNLRYGEDLELWARIAKKYSIAYINSIEAVYNLVADNRSNVNLPRLEESYAQYAEIELDDFRKSGRVDEHYEEYVFQRNIILAHLHLASSNRKEARRVLWKVRATRLNRRQWIVAFFRCFWLTNRIYDVIKKM